MAGPSSQSTSRLKIIQYNTRYQSKEFKTSKEHRRRKGTAKDECIHGNFQTLIKQTQDVQRKKICTEQFQNQR